RLAQVLDGAEQQVAVHYHRDGVPVALTAGLGVHACDSRPPQARDVLVRGDAPRHRLLGLSLHVARQAGVAPPALVRLVQLRDVPGALELRLARRELPAVADQASLRAEDRPAGDGLEPVLT